MGVVLHGSVVQGVTLCTYTAKCRANSQKWAGSELSNSKHLVVCVSTPTARSAKAFSVGVLGAIKRWRMPRASRKSAQSLVENSRALSVVMQVTGKPSSVSFSSMNVAM